MMQFLQTPEGQQLFMQTAAAVAAAAANAASATASTMTASASATVPSLHDGSSAEDTADGELERSDGPGVAQGSAHIIQAKTVTINGTVTINQRVENNTGSITNAPTITKQKKQQKQWYTPHLRREVWRRIHDRHRDDVLAAKTSARAAMKAAFLEADEIVAADTKGEYKFLRIDQTMSDSHNRVITQCVSKRPHRMRVGRS